MPAHVKPVVNILFDSPSNRIPVADPSEKGMAYLYDNKVYICVTTQPKGWYWVTLDGNVFRAVPGADLRFSWAEPGEYKPAVPVNLEVNVTPV